MRGAGSGARDQPCASPSSRGSSWNRQRPEVSSTSRCWFRCGRSRPPPPPGAALPWGAAGPDGTWATARLAASDTAPAMAVADRRSRRLVAVGQGSFPSASPPCMAGSRISESSSLPRAASAGPMPLGARRRPRPPAGMLGRRQARRRRGRPRNRRPFRGSPAQGGPWPFPVPLVGNRGTGPPSWLWYARSCGGAPSRIWRRQSTRPSRPASGRSTGTRS